MNKSTLILLLFCPSFACGMDRLSCGVDKTDIIKTSPRRSPSVDANSSSKLKERRSSIPQVVEKRGSGPLSGSPITRQFYCEENLSPEVLVALEQNLNKK